MKVGKWDASSTNLVRVAGKLAGIAGVTILVAILMVAATVGAAVITSFLAEFGDNIRITKGWK